VRIPIGTLCIICSGRIQIQFSYLGRCCVIVSHLSKDEILLDYCDVVLTAEEPYQINCGGRQYWADRDNLIPITPDADILDMETEKVKDLVR